MLCYRCGRRREAKHKRRSITVVSRLYFQFICVQVTSVRRVEHELEHGVVAFLTNQVQNSVAEVVVSVLSIDVLEIDHNLISEFFHISVQYGVCNLAEF